MNLNEYKAKMRAEFDGKFSSPFEVLRGYTSEAQAFLDTALDNLLVEVEGTLVGDLLVGQSDDRTEEFRESIMARLTRFKGEERKGEKCCDAHEKGECKYCGAFPFKEHDCPPKP